MSQHEHDHDHHDHDHHDHDHHGHDHGHGHHNDQGLAGALRYLRWAPRMWRSDINTAVVDLVAPQPGELVVDIGAGLGAAVVKAAARDADVIAVEPTPYMRRILAARCLVHRSGGDITVADGAAEKIPINGRTADAVWAVNTMHHWIDPEIAAREIARVLKPGGRMVLIDEDFEDPTHPEFERFASNHDGDHHGFSMVDAEHFGSLFSGAGLADVEATRRQLAGRPVIAVTAVAIE